MKQFLISGFLLIVFTTCSSGTPQSKMSSKVPVEIAQATKNDVPVILSTIGNVYARVTVQLRPQIQGRIIETNVKQGQYVKKGDLLYTIDPRVYQANVAKAQAVLDKDQAQLLFAKQRLDRYSQLKEKEFVSPLTLEEYRSNADTFAAQIIADQADLDLAKIELNWCFVYSPIDGKISQFQIDIGNLVKAYDDNALTEILEIKPVEVRFAFPQKDFIEIKKYFSTDRLPFSVSDPSYPKIEYEGVVDFIDNKIDLNTGTILLKGIVPNEKELLWPGAFVWVQVHLKTENNAITVPKQAVQLGQQGPFVFVIKEDLTADLRKVILGYETSTIAIIKEGVKEGETVVTNGQLNLKPGSKVEIKK